MSHPKIADDPRLDPRLKTLLASFPNREIKDVANREELLARANTPEAQALVAAAAGFMEMCDTEAVAPSEGLRLSTREFISDPDGNTIKIQLIQPESPTPLPCVFYIHGGGMQALSCFNGNYRAFGKIIAAEGVHVAMVDFRNSISPLL